MEKISIEEKVRMVLKAVDIEEPSKATIEEILLGLGRLLSVKAKKKASVHEVTKEVRRALELAVLSPLSQRSDEELVVSVKYTHPPFKSSVLNEAYRRLLERLVRHTTEQARKLSPMWRRRLVNLIVENIYNIAIGSDTYEYKKKIKKIFEVPQKTKEVKTSGAG
ncbi:MAG: hypothetical protein QW301_00080 [Desulfurococcaceae archaeon]